MLYVKSPYNQADNSSFDLSDTCAINNFMPAISQEDLDLPGHQVVALHAIQRAYGAVTTALQAAALQVSLYKNNKSLTDFEKMLRVCTSASVERAITRELKEKLNLSFVTKSARGVNTRGNDTVLVTGVSWIRGKNLRVASVPTEMKSSGFFPWVDVIASLTSYTLADSTVQVMDVWATPEGSGGGPRYPRLGTGWVWPKKKTPSR